MMRDDRDLLVAWLHDPPDKVLNIRGHESRACRYLSTALGISVDPSVLRQHHADQVASATERLPMPRWDAEPRTVVGPDQLLFVHPLSPEDKVDSWVEAEKSVDENAIQSAIEELVGEVDDLANRFLILWRQLPDRLAASRVSYGYLPADTRVPDHTIWQHLDTTAGLHASLAGPRGGGFLCFSIGPVQAFITTARTVRDLWTGSMILSWLTFRAMLPIVEQLGPTAMIYPSLRGIPLLDLWLRKRPDLEKIIDFPKSDARRMPCIPNRFVAMVPWGESGGDANQLAESCRQAASDAWHEVAEAVHEKLDKSFSGHCPGWDRHWNAQIDNFFDFRTSLVPWRECDDATLARLLRGHKDFSDAFPDAANVRKLEIAIPEQDRVNYRQRCAGQWQYRLELSARLLEADKAIRHIPPPTDVASDDQVAAKCSMMGTVEQMGPPKTGDAADFWDNVAKDHSIRGVRVRPGERLGAVAFVKRFAGPVKLWRELGFPDAQELRFDDTATIAAAGWLERARTEGFKLLDPQEARNQYNTWSGQWLHGSTSDSDPDADPCPEEIMGQIKEARKPTKLGPPPAYYAVLAMDGDRLGDWLSGRKSPRIREVLHSRLVEYFSQFEDAKDGLNAPRPVTPALHAAISEALANFALHFVPKIIKRHKGTLIYAGGDDVLALLPTAGAVACAAELSDVYRKPWDTDSMGRRRLLMGPRATLSAGLAIVHHKEDLRFSLKTARDAEHRAKESGRDALEIVACRRSGEHASALCPWPFASMLEGWTRAFEQGASDRWAYHLRAELETLRALPSEAMAAELSRQMNRSEPATKKLFDPEGDGKQAGKKLVEAFEVYRSATKPDGTPRFASPGDALESFITLCQTASFLARGRDA